MIHAYALLGVQLNRDEAVILLDAIRQLVTEIKRTPSSTELLQLHLNIFNAEGGLHCEAGN